MNFGLSGFPRTPKLAFFCLALLSVSLSGCGKIKSTFDSVFRSRHEAKTAPVPPPKASGPKVSGPRLAIILDDVGSDPGAAQSIFSLHYPLTLSILPHHPHSTEIAQQAHHRGYQVMLHLPMQSVGNEVAEIQELKPGMSTAEVSTDLHSMLSSVPYAAGINNHQGSLATSDAHLMAELMPLLRRRHLFFIDSRTTAATVAYESAEAAGVPCAFRNVPFLDDVQDIRAIRHQLELASKDAREKGAAIAIGHPHPQTLHALREFLPQAQTEGIRLVHASDLVH